jgi:hypothetical protein
MTEAMTEAMTEPSWFYCEGDYEHGQGRSVGPVTLAQLAELIHSGALAYDVPVSTNETDWHDADNVAEVVRAVPLERERMIQEFIYYGETPDPEWGWASDRMYSYLDHMPERAWELIVELMERAPSDGSLNYFAAGPLEDLLSEDGPAFIDRVEQRAAESPKFRTALTYVWRLGMAEDVWQRVQAIARPERKRLGRPWKTEL